MPNIIEMKKQRAEALAKAEAIIAAADTANRAMTDAERADANAAMAEHNGLNSEITLRESAGTIRANFGRDMLPTNPAVNNAQSSRFSAEHVADYGRFLASRGADRGSLPIDSDGGIAVPRIGANLYEGSNPAGGYAVPSVTEGQVIALAPPQMGVQALATVIPTVSDVRFPRKTAHGTAEAKSESGGSNNAFGGADPTIDQFTLSAFMLGHIETASWELLQDVNVFQAFLTGDILLSMAELKESWFVNGSGTGQAQGLIGNTGAGVTNVSNTAAALLNAALTVQGELNTIYQANATYLMKRATGVALRLAQVTANLFNPAWTSANGTDYLYGQPVAYSDQMPALGLSSTPVLYGDFKSGYIIGERGGSGINIKILDQPKAQYGLLDILGYQRIDGRVRRSEAIQAITIAAS